jgi:malignant T-cell-amplified sequence
MQNRMQVDKGAIRHIFSGSHIMAPGLISEGGKLCENVDVNAAVSVFAEGKEHAICVGVMLMSSAQIEDEKKGEAINVVQFMNDGMWHLKPIVV